MSKGITLRYPAAWWPISVSEQRVDILSSKGGAKGVVIHRGQAQIIASVLDRTPDSFEEFIDLNLRNQTLISSEELSPTQPAACARLRKVVSLQEEGPGTYVVNTGMFCDTDRGRVLILLRNWQGDPRQAHYQRVELQMAKSIRLN